MENQLVLQLALLFVILVCYTLLFITFYAFQMPGMYSDSGDRLVVTVIAIMSAWAFSLTPDTALNLEQLTLGVLSYLSCILSFIMIIIVIATKRPRNMPAEVIGCLGCPLSK